MSCDISFDAPSMGVATARETRENALQVYRSAKTSTFFPYKFGGLPNVKRNQNSKISCTKSKNNLKKTFHYFFLSKNNSVKDFIQKAQEKVVPILYRRALILTLFRCIERNK